MTTWQPQRTYRQPNDSFASTMLNSLKENLERESRGSEHLETSVLKLSDVNYVVGTGNPQ